MLLPLFIWQRQKTDEHEIDVNKRLIEDCADQFYSRFVSLQDEVSSRVMDEINRKDRDSLLAEIRNLHRNLTNASKLPQEQVNQGDREFRRDDLYS